MKIAQYRWSNIVTYKEVDDYMEKAPDYIRISEIVDVEFSPLAPEILVPKELAQLDLMEQELTDKHLKALGAIQTKRKDLLSLAPPKAVEAA